MLSTGSLDLKVALERNLSAQDSTGQPIENWRRIGVPRWARFVALGGTERYTATQFVAREQVQWTVRWAKDISELGPGDRLVFPVKDDPSDNQIYDIIAVHEMGWREGLVLTTARRAEALREITA